MKERDALVAAAAEWRDARAQYHDYLNDKKEAEGIWDIIARRRSYEMYVREKEISVAKDRAPFDFAKHSRMEDEAREKFLSARSKAWSACARLKKAATIMGQAEDALYQVLGDWDEVHEVANGETLDTWARRRARGL